MRIQTDMYRKLIGMFSAIIIAMLSFWILVIYNYNLSSLLVSFINLMVVFCICIWSNFIKVSDLRKKTISFILWPWAFGYALASSLRLLIDALK